jgi:hypothetical protein
MFTNEAASQDGTEELPLGYTNKRYMYEDEDTGRWLRVPIRRKMRKMRREEVEVEWKKGTGSQDEVIKEIGRVEPLLKKLTKRSKEHKQAGDLATLARVITQVHNLEPYYEGRFDMSNDCEYCKQRTGELRGNTAKHEQECRFDEQSRDRKIAECLEMAVTEAKLRQAEQIEVQDRREQRGMERLMLMNKFVKRGRKVLIQWGERFTKAPTQERIKRMTVNFIRHNKDHNQYRRMIFEATHEANSQGIGGIEINRETWKMIREGFGCDIQLHTRAAVAALDIPEFTSQWAESRLGSKDSYNYVQKRPAAQVEDGELEEYIDWMETRQGRKTDTWSIVLTRASRWNRNTLEGSGYQRVATTGGSERSVDIHLKVGSTGRITNEEVLIHLESLQTWGTKGVNEIDREAFIKMTAAAPWKEDETAQRRRTLIVEAMGWMNSPTADRGVQTQAQVTYMVERGVERRSAQRIVTRTTDTMFDEYARDNKRKRDYCKEKLDQQEREKQRQKKLELEKERQERREQKEAVREKKNEDKRKLAEEKKRVRQEAAQKKRDQNKEKKENEREKKKEERRKQVEEKQRLRQEAAQKKRNQNTEKKEAEREKKKQDKQKQAKESESRKQKLIQKKRPETHAAPAVRTEPQKKLKQRYTELAEKRIKTGSKEEEKQSDTRSKTIEEKVKHRKKDEDRLQRWHKREDKWSRDAKEKGKRKDVRDG